MNCGEGFSGRFVHGEGLVGIGVGWDGEMLLMNSFLGMAGYYLMWYFG